MKKAAFIIILALFSLTFLQAETVLFCISDNGEEEEKSPWTIAVLRAFEDGVLNEFFEAGHIVTNSFLNECKRISGSDAKNNSDIARIMGNRLGADRVMILEVIFPDAVEDTLPVPIAAEYGFYENTGKTLLSQMTERLNIPMEMGEEELLDSFTAAGQGFASGLVDKM